MYPRAVSGSIRRTATISLTIESGTSSPALHHFSGRFSQRRTLGHIGSQQIARRNLRDSPKLHQLFGLGSFAHAGSTQQKDRTGYRFCFCLPGHFP